MSNLPRCVLVVMTGLMLLIPAAACAAGAAFSAPPTATRHGDLVEIRFAVGQPTDVAVYIEDAHGKVVRHLAAGVLGEHAPTPLKAGSLSQALVWDGKTDDGSPAPASAFRVRVALGLHAVFDRVALSEPQNLAGSKGGVAAMAVAPAPAPGIGRGRDALYITANWGAHVPNWTGSQLLAFDRDGKYGHTILPPPADTPADTWRAFGAKTIEVGGQTIPVIADLAERRFFGEPTDRKTAMAVTPAGVILTLTGPHIAAVTADSKPAWGAYTGPKLLPDVARLGVRANGGLAVSSDGKWAYVSGLRDEAESRKAPPFAAVFRVKLPGRGPAEPFVGDPAQGGADDKHLSDDVRGLADDGHGRLFIADHGNNRVVVVSESDGRVLGSIAVEKPQQVAVEPTTGHVYVTRIVARYGVELVKFSGWQDAKPLVRHRLPYDGNPDFPWSLALVPGKDPGGLPGVWLGGDRGRLLRLTERDGNFTADEVASNDTGTAGFADVQVDRFRDPPEVYVRTMQDHWLRYNEATGAVDRIALDLPANAGTCIVPGKDGCIYAPAYPYYLYRFDRDGRPAPWPGDAQRYPASVINWRKGIDEPKGPAHATYLPVSMTYMTHTLGVRGDGRLFALDPGKPRTRPPKMLVEVGRDGRRVGGPIVWKVSDTAVGPKFDAEGNIYIAEQIRPLDQPAPPEFAAWLGDVKVGTTLAKGPKAAVGTMYGSIVKFSPKGGMIHWKGTDPFEGQPALDPSLKTVDAMYFTGGGRRFEPVKVTGALWMHVGVSHVALHACNCETTRFDVDPFGRVFYPDLGRFRVGVLDTNGNVITEFGRYGNADDARDQLALAWLIGVGVTDRYVYLGDSMNRRLLRAKLVYEAEATCAVR
jgi:hypothetical protein